MLEQAGEVEDLEGLDRHAVEDGGARSGDALAEPGPVVDHLDPGRVPRHEGHCAAALVGVGHHGDPVREEGAG